ncbi:MAG: Gfo/Idh/MocA family oxidoreductase [Oscillospiraceae bacterium]|nr:Gfo/Idh/MocA family oxidoreductase [Oscillospiraceae bacterium]
MIPYAVIGTGWISGSFIRAARDTELALAGICSRTRARGMAFAREQALDELPVYQSVEALARDSAIKACYVASPNRFHAAQCEILLEAGKHVLCEKPVTVTPGELERLQKLAARRGLIFQEAIMYLHTPERRAVRELLPRLGGMQGAMLDFSQRSSKYDSLLAGELPNVFNPAMAAGAWMDLGIYCLYPALDFFGEPERAFAHARFLKSGADGAGAAVFQYRDFPVTLSWCKTGQSRGVSQIIGDEGTLTLASISQFQGVAHYNNEGYGSFIDVPRKKHEVMQWEARAFCDYILGRPSMVPYEEASALALRVSKWMEQIRALAGISL